MNKIASSEITFHPHSIIDSKLRLFWWKGNLYRGIGTEEAVFITKLFKDGLIQKLIEQELLIESEVIPLEIDGFDMVVSHRTLPFTSYSIEWCPAMVKDAVLTLLEFGIEVAKHGFALEDAHLGNVLFDGYKPIFIDLGSIKPFDKRVHYFRWESWNEFLQYSLYPLILMSQGKDKVARLLMFDQEGISISNLLLLTRRAGRSVQLPNPPIIVRLQLGLMQVLRPPYLDWLRNKLSSIQAIFTKQSHELQPESEVIESRKPQPQSELLEKIRQKTYLKLLEETREYVKRIKLHSFPTKSLNPSESSILSLVIQDAWTAKQMAVYKCLTELKPSSVLDIGCRTGWYSKLAAFSGSQVVAFDKNPDCITQLYYDAHEKKLPILPLVMDFTQLTPAYGLSSYRYMAATERFQCEMVLALGLVHHIVYEQKPPQFDHIVQGLALLSNRWLIVEFVPLEDLQMIRFRSLRHSWYTLENFLTALRKRFSSIHTMPSHPESRVLLVCEK